MNTEHKFNWLAQSVTLKLVIIIVLTLLLLIPSAMIHSIIRERQNLSTSAIEEVSSKWAERQVLNGPILTIPLIYETFHDYDKSVTYETRYWHILPDELQIDGGVSPQTLRRGIYEVAVYTSLLDISGRFRLEENINRTNLHQISYAEAFLTIGVSDLRGIKENIHVQWGDSQLTVEPGTRIPHVIASGVTVELPDISGMVDSAQTFKFALHLQGSHDLSFVPAGSTTDVTLHSDWTSPSFNGHFLPNDREITDSGFTASWKVLQVNRNFPQTWTGTQNTYDMSKAAFGVNLMLPLDDYQKSERSVKYAIMTIALTFLVFFLVEILNKQRIHPFQYTLVGLALCLFYVLLVSISEHTSFNIAYLLSFFAVLLMITLYSIKILKTRRLSLLLGFCLTGIYGFVYVTLQLTDYALLMGSIGLALILAMTMYFTRNIDWYALRIGKGE